MTDDYLTTLAKLGEDATEGPWSIEREIDGVHADKPTVVATRRDGYRRIVTVGQTRPHEIKQAAENIRFIAVSRNVWDELVAVVRVAERLSTWTEPGIEYLEADLQVALAALKAKVESL